LWGTIVTRLPLIVIELSRIDCASPKGFHPNLSPFEGSVFVVLRAMVYKYKVTELEKQFFHGKKLLND